MWSNCWVWAAHKFAQHLAVWLQRGRPRGCQPGVKFRPSDLEPWWIPHATVSWWDYKAGFRVEASFVPINKRPLRWWQLWRILWFRGYVKVGS